jgi:hypothetical protein
MDTCTGYGSAMDAVFFRNNDHQERPLWCEYYSPDAELLSLSLREM